MTHEPNRWGDPDPEARAPENTVRTEAERRIETGLPWEDQPDPDAVAAIADLNAGLRDSIDHWTNEVWPHLDPYEWVLRAER